MTETIGVISLSDQPKEGLPETLEKELKKTLGKKISNLICRKYNSQITQEFYAEHHCLRAKRSYKTKEGKTIVILCPHLLTESGEKFYELYEKMIYEGLERVLSQIGDV